METTLDTKKTTEEMVVRFGRFAYLQRVIMYSRSGIVAAVPAHEFQKENSSRVPVCFISDGIPVLDIEWCNPDHLSHGYPIKE